MPNGKREIKVNLPEQIQKGVYSNNTIVSHTKEEFIIDFLMVTPPAGTVASRVIVSPGHMKRIISTLQENLMKYETKFGTIEIFRDPGDKIHIQ